MKTIRKVYVKPVLTNFGNVAHITKSNSTGDTFDCAMECGKGRTDPIFGTGIDFCS